MLLPLGVVEDTKPVRGLHRIIPEGLATAAGTVSPVRRPGDTRSAVHAVGPACFMGHPPDALSRSYHLSDDSTTARSDQGARLHSLIVVPTVHSKWATPARA